MPRRQGERMSRTLCAKAAERNTEKTEEGDDTGDHELQMSKRDKAIEKAQTHFGFMRNLMVELGKALDEAEEARDGPAKISPEKKRKYQ